MALLEWRGGVEPSVAPNRGAPPGRTRGRRNSGHDSNRMRAGLFRTGIDFTCRAAENFANVYRFSVRRNILIG
ncbi:hypothetical protein [Burkholderia stagnalis]|uniref:hypothetical protein n=1 Tax=Burkholderia stagnalis TaxID=1503054 RepID=UPI000F813572|nr:hypothetical protein [Burkholderia stagnalis]